MRTGLPTFGKIVDSTGYSLALLDLNSYYFAGDRLNAVSTCAVRMRVGRLWRNIQRLPSVSHARSRNPHQNLPWASAW